MIGFLKTSNRINVMLSRAKHGMYILGHADTLIASKKSTMWRQVLSKSACPAAAAATGGCTSALRKTKLGWKL